MSRPITLFVKDPDSVEPQGFDWTDWLAEFATAEFITSSDWQVDGLDVLDPFSPDTSLQLSDEAVVSGAVKTQVLLSLGTVGFRYTVTNRVVTTSGYTEDRSFPVLIQEC